MVQQVEHGVARKLQIGARQRFDATRGFSDCDHVVSPRGLAHSLPESTEAWLRQRLHRGQQILARFIVNLMRAAVHLPHADGTLQRHAPLPAGGTAGELHVRLSHFSHGAGRTQGSVARQPSRPFLETRAEEFADELCAGAGAIDEQVGAQLPAILELKFVDAAVLRARRANYLAIEADHPGTFGGGTKETGHQRGIHVEREAQVRRHTQRIAGEYEAVRQRQRDFLAEHLEPGLQAQHASLVPEVIERAPFDECAERAEAVPEGFSDRGEIDHAPSEAVG